MAEEKTILLTQEAYDKMKKNSPGVRASTVTRFCPRSPRRVPKAI